MVPEDFELINSLPRPNLVALRILHCDRTQGGVSRERGNEVDDPKPFARADQDKPFEGTYLQGSAFWYGIGEMLSAPIKFEVGRIWSFSPRAARAERHRKISSAQRLALKWKGKEPVADGDDNGRVGQRYDTLRWRQCRRLQTSESRGPCRRGRSFPVVRIRYTQAGEILLLLFGRENSGSLSMPITGVLTRLLQIYED
jgi:hypothetical protein